MARGEPKRSSPARKGLRFGAVVLAVMLAFAVVGVVGLWGSHWLATLRTDCRVAALMFHSVVPGSEATSRYQMTETEFAAQMRELQQHEVEPIDLDEFLEFIEAHSGSPRAPCPYPEGAVLVTFDMDGASYHVDTVLGPLMEMAIPAVFFVPTGFIDEGRAVSSEAIRTLSRAGFEFGSHSEWHRDLRRVEPIEMRESLERSRGTLEGLTGRDVRSISAPGGRYDADAIEAVRTVGFSALFNSDPCVIRGTRSRFEICRIEIRGDRGMRAVHAVTSPGRVAMQATSWDLKRGIEGVIGDRGWRWLRWMRETLGS